MSDENIVWGTKQSAPAPAEDKYPSVPFANKAQNVLFHYADKRERFKTPVEFVEFVNTEFAKIVDKVTKKESK